MREWQISAAQTRERLREVIAEFQSQTVEGLQEAEIAVADARLLNQLARYAKLFALVELSEVMVPFMYLLVIGTLHTDTFGYNREHFFVFDQLGESYHDAMVSSSD
ncbi:unnamed protein product [Durusdinium trenchii]|uniref:Uncharacterized protein n=1 Tax=Durusdinium trenchii TaxID=1381693 RepID=A0ABP0KBF8_9DINO